MLLVIATNYIMETNAIYFVIDVDGNIWFLTVDMFGWVIVSSSIFITYS
jgi:hypothetical protein